MRHHRKLVCRFAQGASCVSRKMRSTATHHTQSNNYKSADHVLMYTKSQLDDAKDYSGALKQLARNWKQGQEGRIVEDYPSMHLATIWKERNDRFF